jgi:hypothetical protein
MAAGTGAGVAAKPGSAVNNPSATKESAIFSFFILLCYQRFCM